jgi:hypothetical protein
VQQQTGMPFIIRQQVQPDLHMAVMQSQQPWIIAQQVSSPLVQVKQHPSSVNSQVQVPITRLQQQTIIPFIITQQEHIPPVIMVQRFCIMVLDIGSAHEQWIFIPPLHFSNFMVQRGIIIMFMPAGMDMPGIEPMVPAPLVGIVMPPMPIMPIIRSVIVLAISAPLLLVPGHEVEPKCARGRRSPPRPNMIGQGPSRIQDFFLRSYYLTLVAKMIILPFKVMVHGQVMFLAGSTGHQMVKFFTRRRSFNIW